MRLAAQGAVRRRLTGPRAGALAAVVLLLVARSPAVADEGGTPFWISGQYASLAAVPPSPGWSLPTALYYYRGRATVSTTPSAGPSVAVDADSRSPMLALQPTYVPDITVLGRRLSLGLGFGVEQNDSRQDTTVSGGGPPTRQSDVAWGATDLAPLADVAWSHGVHNWLLYLTGNVPVGSYDSDRLANAGIGHGAIDAGGGYTFLDTRIGLEASAVIGFTYNFENPSTRYRSGIDSHLDWGLSMLLPHGWQAGLVGYAYYQLTGDSASGAELGPFRSKVVAIGAQLGYQFGVGGQQWYANLRGYYEPWAENRLRGYALFATLNVPLSGYRK